MHIKYHAHGPSRLNACYSLTKIVISDDSVTVETVKSRNGLNTSFVGFGSVIAHIWHDILDGAELELTNRNGQRKKISLEDVIEFMEEW